MDDEDDEHDKDEEDDEDGEDNAEDEDDEDGEDDEHEDDGEDDRSESRQAKPSSTHVASCSLVDSIPVVRFRRLNH